MIGNKNGFTLIEILIAITILSFMSISVFTIVNQSTETQERVTVEDKELLEVESALKRIDYDFSQLFTPLYYSSPQISEDNNEDNRFDSNSNIYNEHDYFDGLSKSGHPIPAIFYEKNKEFLIFTYSNRRKFEDSKESNYSWVRYYLSTSKDNTNLMQLNRQMRSTDIYSKELDWNDTPSYTLISNIKKIELFFWDLENEDWKESVPEKNKYFSPLIRCKLIWEDSNGNENYIDRTFRILWPEFDTIRDDQIRDKAMYPDKNEEEEES